MIKSITNKYFLATAIFLITLLIYSLSYQGEGKHFNYFVYLAEAFLQGRIYLIANPSWLNELLDIGGKYYVVYPPMPAFMLIPPVAIFGSSFPQPYLSILIGAANAGLLFLLSAKVFRSRPLALVLSLLLAFGTIHWYHAEVGSAWYIAHIIAIFFILLSLLEIFTKQRLFLVGFLIGLAYLSRLPAILAIVFPLIYLSDRFIQFKDRKINLFFRSIFLLSLGLLPSLIINFGYNYLRFGVFYDASYSLLPIFDEPWYQYGLFNIKYIPTHLIEIFTALPTFQSEFPFLIPSWNVMALWFVTPAFLLILLADFKKKLTIASLLTVIVMALPGLAHGSNGFAQFGFRFALDYHPFLLLLVGLGFRNKLSWWKMALVGLSILINLWGVVMLSFYNFYTM